jgi:hypothetical protein
LKSSSVFTAPLPIPEPAWGSPFASGSSNGLAVAAGSILLAEDNPADAALVRKALEEHGVQGDRVHPGPGRRPVDCVSRPCDHRPESSEKARPRGSGRCGAVGCQPLRSQTIPLGGIPEPRGDFQSRADTAAGMSEWLNAGGAPASLGSTIGLC